MLSFSVKGGDQAALDFVKLEIVFEATSLGGLSLVQCPFNTSHMFVPEDVRLEAGILRDLSE